MSTFVKRTGGESGSGGVDPALEARVEILEDNEYKVSYFVEINADSGTITLPIGATIMLDQFPGGIDAYVSTISSGQPTGDNPLTAGGALVDVTSFDADGDFVLTGVPSSYPVALIFNLKIAASNWSNLDLDNVIEYERTTGLPLSSTDNALARFDGTTGNIQNSTVLLNDEGSITLPQIAGPAYVRGKLAYDTTNEALTFFNNESDIGLQIGQETYIRVYNNSGSTISNGSAVYISGQSSGLPTIALAKADAASTTRCVGLATHSIENNSIGYVTSIGLVRNFDTSAFSAGNVVFLSESVAGGLTSTEPSGANYSYRVGFVISSHATTGTVQVISSTAMRAPTLPGYQGLFTQSYLANTLIAAADSTTYYFGGPMTAAASTTAASRRLYIPRACTIKGAFITFIHSSGGTTETSTMSIRHNNTTDTTISAVITNDATVSTWSNMALSIAMNGTTDYIEFKWVTPAWVTNPANTICMVTLYLE